MATTKEERDELRRWGGRAENAFLATIADIVLRLLDERYELAKRNVVDADWAHEEIKAGIAFRERAKKAEAEVARLKEEGR